MSEFVAEPKKVLDKAETLALLRADPAEFMNDRDHWDYKSQWICDLLDEREAVAGYQYNAKFQKWFETEYSVGPFGENGSPLSLLIYNAQRYRGHDKMVREGFQPGSDDLLREAFEKKVEIELYSESLFNIVVNGEKMDNPNVSRLKVREIGGKLYAMRPKKRKFAVNIVGRPIRLAS